MDDHSRLLAPYWLRQVRIGQLVTGLAVAALFVLPLLPHDFDIHVGGLMAVLVVATLGGLGVGLLPWAGLFERGWGVRMLEAWSAADIVLVSFGIAATGGAGSPLFFVYALTTVFFGASYALGSQIRLLLFTAGSYVTTLWLTGWGIAVGTLFIQLAALAILTVLTSFLFRELVRQMEAQEETRGRAQEWASLLQTVAEAARGMTLQEQEIVEVTLRSVLRLGFSGVAMTEIAEDGQTYRVVQALGLPEGFTEADYPIDVGATAMVLERGGTVVVDDYAERPEALELLRADGIRSVVGTPVWIGGWLAGVLIGGYRELRSVPLQLVQAFELLAAQAGLALENARRFEEEHRTVERMAELDRMKSDFLATVSHEIRTPVTVIRGVGLTLERVWDTMDDQTRRQMLSGLSEHSRSLEALITTLLDFSRLEAGTPLPATLGDVEIGPVLDWAARRFEEVYGGDRLTLDAEPGLRVRADAVLLERILQNLLSNAGGHTAPGTAVRLLAHAEDDDVVIGVSDDGPGIPDDELPYITERFYRGGDINTRPRGLGLGLALVSEMLEMQDSALELESVPGSGCRFWFRLPAVTTAPPDEGRVDPNEAAARMRSEPTAGPGAQAEAAATGRGS